MSNPQPQGSQAQAQPQQRPQILKPEDLPKLTSLSEDQKAKYKVAFNTIVNMINSKPETSAEHIAARNKLQEWSAKLIQQERAHRLKQQQLKTLNQTPQGQQANQPPQPAQPPQPTPSNPPTQQSQATPLPSGDQKSNTEPGQSTPVQQQQQAMPQPQGQNQAPGAGAPQSGNRPHAASSAEYAQIIKHVNEFPWRLGPGVPVVGAEAEKRVKEMKGSYLNALMKQQSTSKRLAELSRDLQREQQERGQPSPETLNTKRNFEAQFLGAKRFIDELRKKQNEWKAQGLPQYTPTQAQTQQQPQPQPQPPQSQSQPPTSQQHQNAPPSVEKPEPHIKVEPGQGQPTQQFTNMTGGMPQPQQNVQPTGASLAQPPPRQPPIPHPPPPQQQQQLPPHAHPSFPQPGQQPHPAQRPQINPQQANAAMQQQQTHSPHPHSAVSAGPGGPPVPLSHHAAVSAAQRSYSNPDPQRTGTPMQPGQANFHPPGSREREQLNNTKMPIPRTLSTTAPVPVSMGPARPTMGGPNNGAPGPLGQPVITKFPPFQLEGEGDRVLSKRKLDELVRQVTGGSEDALTPEVEEAMLQLADEFVDTVITSACKLAKLRESPNLEIRDLQVILERNYNIRIPGYASDEVRTVRKVVPAPGWTQKMNAVQAAKVMGGKTDI